MNEPVEPDRELARRNNVLGVSLFAIMLLLAAGTVVVALVYDALANF